MRTSNLTIRTSRFRILPGLLLFLAFVFPGCTQRTAEKFGVLSTDFESEFVLSKGTNIILSFHFYQPFPLTHYRASWTKIGEYTGPVHYPGQVVEDNDIKGLPEELVREIGHHNGTFTAYSLEKMILVPVERSRELGLPLYCGEWGCLPTVDAADRLQWYRDVRQILEKHGIAWATWDFRGSFGLVDRATGKPDQELIDILFK